MYVHEVESKFHTWSNNPAQEPHRWTPKILVEVMTTFYEQVRAIEPDLNQDGDMLLFQWGIQTWKEPNAFYFNITRQFIFQDTELLYEKYDPEDLKIDNPDPLIRQLYVSLLYDPAPFQDLTSGNRWCRLPTHVDAFRVWIETSPAFHLATQYQPHHCEILFFDPE